MSNETRLVYDKDLNRFILEDTKYGLALDEEVFILVPLYFRLIYPMWLEERGGLYTSGYL